MELEFTKMHGTGNDFVFIEDLHASLELGKDAVRFLCDRHFGIGADGVILVRPSETEDCIAYMHYINADGSLAQMCGNGIRCFAKYLIDNRFVLSDEDVFKVETLSGVKTVYASRDAAGLMTEATIDMGAPILAPSKVPTTLQPTVCDPKLGDIVQDASVETPAGSFDFTCVSMGNPHAVAFVEDVAGFDVAGVGSFMESHECFPEKTNVEFARVIGGEDGWADIEMRVYERGDGETLACGTGCCATCVAAALTGRTGRKAHLHILGGILGVEWSDEGRVLMTGPATTVYHGTIVLPEDLDVHLACKR